MAKREEFKDVEINGKKWRIGRFDALTGSWIATSLVFSALPMGLDLKTSGATSSGTIINKETFKEIQIECLKVVSELTETDNGQLLPILVLLEDGRWSNKELSKDMTLAINLTIQVLIFNMSDFFQKGALDDLKGTANKMGLGEIFPSLFNAPK
jgi:hypothetical protein